MASGFLPRVKLFIIQSKTKCTMYLSRTKKFQHLISLFSNNNNELWKQTIYPNNNIIKENQILNAGYRNPITERSIKYCSVRKIIFRSSWVLLLFFVIFLYEFFVRNNIVCCEFVFNVYQFLLNGTKVKCCC